MRFRRILGGSRAALLTPALLGLALGCSASGAPPFGSGSSGAGGAGGSGGAASSNSATSSATGSGGGSTASASATASSSATSGAGGSGGSGGGGGSSTVSSSNSTSGAGGGPPVNAEVYAHSPDTLYKLDPITKVVTTVGLFQGCNTVIDIALDKNGNMYGTGFGELYKINKLNAACTLVSNGSYPNSLSFVPAGTLDPVNEALVGYVGSTYVRIDTTTGQVTTVGNLGNNGYSSSGDVVSLIGGSTYLTVNGNGCGDCIVEVNPSTGALIQKIGALGHSSVFGLAYWAGVAYGFDAFGELFQIDVMNGSTQVIPIPNAPAGLVFYGAGSTTAAPLHM